MYYELYKIPDKENVYFHDRMPKCAYKVTEHKVEKALTSYLISKHLPKGIITIVLRWIGVILVFSV